MIIPIFFVTNIRKIFRSGIRTQHTGQTSPTLRDSSCSRNSKNYFSDITFNYSYSDSRKVPKIKADVLTPVSFNTVTVQLMYTTLDFLVRLNIPALYFFCYRVRILKSVNRGRAMILTSAQELCEIVKFGLISCVNFLVFLKNRFEVFFPPLY